MFRIDSVWVDEDARDEPLTEQILNALPRAEACFGREWQARYDALRLEPDPFARGKRIMRLMRYKGAFIKPCPGTREYVCCGLQILHIGQGCPMDCRYCALQVYFNRPALEVFVNVEEMFDALRYHLELHSDRFHRICTGEFTDSLALDPLTGLAGRLVDFFAARRNAILEIKTKTAFIDPLLNRNPNGRVVLSFSVNRDDICRTQELGAASLNSRIRAAQLAEQSGYLVGFHFDPIVPLPGWAEAYCLTVDRIFEAVDPAGIAWISLGTLRFAPDLKEIADARFGPVPYFHEGFVRGLDGKSRLPADRRIGVYRVLAERIRCHSPNARIYLCMESPHVWRESLGVDMPASSDLSRYLDSSVQDRRRAQV